MIKYITDDGVYMDESDFLQYLNMKINEFRDNRKLIIEFVNGFDEYVINEERWTLYKKLIFG